MTLEEMINRAREQLNMDVISYLNFAFCGPQGSGKSSLINSLRALDDADPADEEPYDMLGSAPAGETETTRETKCYGYPIGHELDFVRLWDHAGCGTQNHPAENYFDDNVLFAYDCVLMITDGGLGEYEQRIIEAARGRSTDVVIVVNKAEQRVEAKIRRRPRGGGALDIDGRRELIQETINEAKVSIAQELLRIEQDPVPVFVVSAWKWRDYENTRSRDDMELAMEIVPLFDHLINTALLRRAA